MADKNRNRRLSRRGERAGRPRFLKGQDDYSLEVALTAGLFIASIFVGYSNLASGSKFSLVVLFGVFEIVFVFSRHITRRIDALARDYLTVIPRDMLSTVLYQHLDSQRTDLLERAKRLSDHHLCELEKHEMYSELIGLTDIVRKRYSGGPKGRIWAISSVNIEDFDDEPLAEAYLDATRMAVRDDVAVCRLFLLDQWQAEDGQVAALLRRHEEALGGNPHSDESGVKWLLKPGLARGDQNQDFALFADDVLVAQSMAGDLAELGFDEVKVSRALATFRRLWRSSGAQRIDSLPAAGT
jgi:hypothetical protein